MSLLQDPLELQRGSWTARLDADGSLAHVRFCDEEILRGVQFVVRDSVWDTITPETSVDVDESPDQTVAQVRATYRFDRATLERTEIITFSSKGLTGSSRIQSTNTISANRIGYVILHPLSLAGAQAKVRHPDGSVTETTFPSLVEPHQPFRQIAGIEHSTPGGATVAIELTGDVFETEDQRNWSDASYKTYSRPLGLPFPFNVTQEQQLEQSWAIRARPNPGTAAEVARSDEPTMPLHADPLIGVALGPDDDPLSAARIARELGLDYVRVDVALDGHNAHGLHRLAAIGTSGVPIELAVHVGADPASAFAQLAQLLESQRPDLSAVAIYDDLAHATTKRAWDATMAGIGGFADHLPTFVGSDDNLAELNRNRPDPRWGATGVTFALTPQVHDNREESILATTEAIRYMVDTASEFGGHVAIGALTMRPRRNIYTGAAIDRLARGDRSADPRQASDFAANWLHAAIAALAKAGVSRITALEFQGARGVVNVSTGAHFPVADVLARREWK